MFELVKRSDSFSEGISFLDGDLWQREVTFGFNWGAVWMSFIRTTCLREENGMEGKVGSLILGRERSKLGRPCTKQKRNCS